MPKTREFRRKNPASWGHLKYAESYYKPVMAKGRTGPYDTGDYGPLFHKYLCDCGREVEWDAKLLPNKRLVTNCGHPDCEFKPKEKPVRVPKAFRPPKPRRVKRVIIGGRSRTFYVPLDVLAGLEAYAEAKQVSTSRAFAELMRLGLGIPPSLNPDA